MTMDADVRIETNKDLFLDAADEAVERALTAIGLQAEGYAKDIITAEPRVDTGRLINSITNAVDRDEKAVYIGSNLEYAVYNEVGTGIYAEGGGGRKTPWMYKDDKGEWHKTSGMKGIHMLKRAASEHGDEYKAIAEEMLKGGE